MAENIDQAKALIRVHKGTSERLAADLETMRERIPPDRDGKDVCETCGLHPHDFTAGEYEDAIREAENRAEQAEAALAEERERTVAAVVEALREEAKREPRGWRRFWPMIELERWQWFTRAADYIENHPRFKPSAPGGEGG